MECKKAYVQESQRQTKEQPEMRIIDENVSLRGNFINETTNCENIFYI